MTDPQPPRWVAEFPGATVTVDADSWLVSADGDDPREAIDLERRIERAAAEGWPNLAGHDIDTTPGWDHDWTFLRLAALGARTVEGPNPQPDEPEPDDGTIVG